MKVNLLCSDRHLPIGLWEQQTDAHWIGIDKGALILVQHGVTPQFAVGDFDSINASEREQLAQHIDINPLNPMKDDTDLALGVEEAVAAGYTEIDIYGATGGRLDHFMGALQVLEKPEYAEQGITLRLLDDQNQIMLLTKGHYRIKNDETYQYISFVPMTYPTTISLKHFKYNLEQTTLTLGSTLTISNELTDRDGEVTISEGHLLMFRSRD